MALWPNARRDLLGFNPVGIASHWGFQQTQQTTQRNLAFFANQSIAQTASIPEGAFQTAACILAPLVAGGMSAANNATDISFSQSANALAGGPVEGAATLTFTQDGGLSLQVTLNGDGSITFTRSGDLALTIGLAADGSIVFSQSGGLSMIVPAEGVASFTLTGSANLKGNLSLSGDITPFTELSPQNLAAAVWGQVVDSGYSAEEIMRLLSAVAAGKTDIVDLGGGAATVKFRDLADTKDRVTASMTGSERTSVTKDVS